MRKFLLIVFASAAVLFVFAVIAADPRVQGTAVVPRSDFTSSISSLAGTIINVNPGSALAGEVFVGVGTSGTNTLPSSRTTNTTVLVQSTAGDGTNAFRVNAAVTHTTGNLMEVQNNSTNVTTINPNGGLTIGRNSESEWAGNQVLTAFYRSDLGEPDHAIVTLGVSDNASVYNYSELKANNTEAKLELAIGSVKTHLSPADQTGTTPYMLNTVSTHTFGTILEVQNNSTNYVQIAADQVSTNTPLILNVNGTQKRVHIGAPDSGGTGLRALTIVN
jgi:hypothetical protein